MSKLFKLFSKNKKTLFFAVSLGLVLFFLPLSFIEADPTVDVCGEHYDFCDGCGPWLYQWPNCIVCFVGYIVSLPVRFAIAAIVIIFGLGALISGVFYAIVALIVTWLMEFMLSVGIVPGAANTPEIVNIGWNFSRQFANLFFILALVFIGLAIVLRIKDYEAKKTLPTLIIIALLINFTPVIVGFVVDMGNIVTNFFLRQVGINSFQNILKTAFDYIPCAIAKVFLRDGDWWKDFFVILGEFIGIIIYGLVLFIFFNLAMFVYLLVGAVFFCRIVILWVLMILSPIAFLSKVFPPGRTTKMIFPDILHWDKWWQSLIQWTIIGIPIGFFLYLSSLVMTSEGAIKGIFRTSDILEPSLQGFQDYASSTYFVSISDQFTSLFTSLLAPVLGLMLLIMGMLISFKAAPEGAKGIMQFATEKGIRRGWQGIRAGYAAMGRAPKTYRSERLTKNWAQAIGPTIRQTFTEAGRQMRDTWKRKQPEGAAPSDEGGAPAALTAPAAGATSATVSHAEEIGGGEEATAEEIATTAPPPAPPAGGHRARIAKVARVFISPRRDLRRGGRVAADILKTTESIASREIDKRMGIGKESEKGEKKKNCPFCSKKIPIDSVVCPYCGERLE